MVVIVETLKREKCPDFGQICHGCKSRSHYWRCCRPRSSKNKTKPAVHFLHSELPYDLSDGATVNIPENMPSVDGVWLKTYSVREQLDKHRYPMVTLKMNNVAVVAKIDTGAM